VTAVTRQARSLDAINFLLSDVRGALGPFLNVFLVTQQHWSQSGVGLVTTISGLLGLAVQTPIGAAIDATPAKRGVIVLALAVLAVGAAGIFAMPYFWPVAIANSLMAIAGDVFGPAVAALTLGLYARGQLARRMGRNSAFDHAGNVAIAVIAGAVGYAFSQRAVFLLVPVFAVLAGAAVLSIPPAAIDHDRARGLDRQAGTAEGAAGYGVLLQSRPLIVFGFCVMLFHLANAALLPLVGQKLAAAYPNEATAMMSACIIAAQMVMLPIALLVGRTADTWGRALYLFRQQLLADRRAGARRRGRRHFRRPHAAGDRRYHARDRALQFGAGRGCHHAGNWGVAERPVCRRDRRSLRVFCHLPEPGECRRDRSGCLRDWHAGNGEPGHALRGAVGLAVIVDSGK